MDVRTRFAPSPTGYMHIGNLRTALYSYLIARRNNGKFILRIEDTDKNRYVDDAINVIYNTLNTAKLTYDEGPNKEGTVGPYIQSNRLDIYKKYAEELVKLGKAYYCFCPEAKSDIDTYKEETNYTTGIGYNRHCRNLTQEEIAENLKNHIPYCIRQKIEDDIIVEYEDTVYGKLTFNSSTLDDQVLLKQDGYPTYNFANVIDDHLMEITHVVRGNEYLSSTPKYILLYKAFNWEIPTFIHLPLINGMDETGNISKLSKRHGAVSFEELVKNGYLPEAILNYIVFLGWNSKTTQEIFSLKELENVFEIKNINKADATGRPFSPYSGESITTVLPARLNSGETTLSILSVVTAKEIRVGGTSSFSKLPLIESLPPIAATPKSICAVNAPRSAERGLPHLLGSFIGFSKYSWKVR